MIRKSLVFGLLLLGMVFAVSACTPSMPTNVDTTSDTSANVNAPADSNTNEAMPAADMNTNIAVPAPDTNTNNNPVPPVAVSSAVTIQNFSFGPSSLVVKKGTTVTWTNNDSAPHTIVGGSFSSATLSHGQSFSYTFTQVGTFAYHCGIHPSMQGQVVVQ